MTKKIPHSEKLGQQPGSLHFVGTQKVEKPTVKLITYSNSSFESKRLKTFDEIPAGTDIDLLTWIHIEGLHDTELIRAIGKRFNIGNLILEDILNTTHLPKVEIEDNLIFLILKNADIHQSPALIRSQQVSILMGYDFVVSFSESPSSFFNIIEHRIEAHANRAEHYKPDFLLYSLLDIIVDSYFTVVDSLGDRIDSLEQQIEANSDTSISSKTINLRKDLSVLSRNSTSIREIVALLEKIDSRLITATSKKYFRDVFDHIIQIRESTESQRELLSSIHELYLSKINLKTNEIMKVLTMITTIFIPMTFLAGVYGMNFKYIPELEWYWGYPASIVLMLAIGFTMIWYFKRKKWL